MSKNKNTITHFKTPGHAASTINRATAAVVADPKCRMSPASRGSSKANADGAYTSTTSTPSFAAARAAAAFASNTLGEVIARLARAAPKGTSTARCAPCSFIEEPARGHADRPRKCSGKTCVVDAKTTRWNFCDANRRTCSTAAS